MGESVSTSDQASESLMIGMWCCPLVEGDAQAIRDVKPPRWLDSDATVETYTISVDVEIGGAQVFVWGQHIGPAESEHNWYHLSLRQHWNLEWMGYEPGHEDPDLVEAALPEVYSILPSAEAWHALGSWLLGAALAARMSLWNSDPEEMSAAIAEQWEFFASRFAR